ncbi:MAG TPA: sulfurtransferase [Candidatus Dormibacteraeota bacterium]|jgi:thiosulfate/3-mercaptopyruvate sulfurtransferase|nr:sulfurtransferase [Candidatus Dormibacteraeota bacterium]
MSTPHASPLVTPAELDAALRGAVPPAVLDVRWWLGGPSGIEAYRAGHVRGASFVDLDAELAGPPGRGGRHPLPDAAAFEAAMRRHGVSAGRPVVAYDQGDNVGAARAWWVLGYFGHPDVRVLDGGVAAWTAAGLPVTTGEAPAAPGDFHAMPGGRPMLDADQARAVALRGVLLDGRTAIRYRGEHEPIDPVAGHIPGARSAPTGEYMDPATGRFLAPDDLRRRVAALGIDAGTEVGAYCGSGVTAAHSVLALAAAGVPASLYVGSWSEWITDPARPVAKAP